MNRKHSAVVIWLLSGCFLIFAMVIIGGITRLTGSGLSMVEWKLVGSVPPMNDAEWQILFDKYKTSPEFNHINSWFTLSDFKGIFWWEYIHRFLGRIIGIVFIVPFLWFLIRKKFPPGFTKKALILFAAGLGQGVLGWVMVKSGLNKVPHVSHYLLAAHLAAAFTTFALAFTFALELLYPVRKPSVSPRTKRLAQFLFAAICIQIVYGAFVAGLKAGYCYPTWPKMGDNWIPLEMFSAGSFSNAVLANAAGVQFVHRTLAIAILILSGFYLFRLRKEEAYPSHRKPAIIAITALIVQIFLGISALIFFMPIAVASAHQIWAFVLFATLLVLLHRLRQPDNDAEANNSIG